MRWAYQYIVLNEYLPAVCDPAVVADVRANGLRYYSPDDDSLFMPLEFSVAAFRFGHSMIRPQYMVNATTTLSLAKLLGVAALLGPGPPPQIGGPNIIEWHNFAVIAGHPGPQFARKLDPLLSADLGDLLVNLPESSIPMGALMRHLARRNLPRGLRALDPDRPSRGERDDDAPLLQPARRPLISGRRRALGSAISLSGASGNDGDGGA